MKKGSLDISIQAIIIVVLGMTLLGLGLTFVRNQFTGFGNLADEVQGETRDRIINELRTTGDKISFPRSSTFGTNTERIVTLGVQNIGAQVLYYKVNLEFDEKNSDEGYTNFKLRYDDTCQPLSPAESDVRNINIRSPRTPGTFALRAEILRFADEGCSAQDTFEPKYATVLSFIKVN